MRRSSVLSVILILSLASTMYYSNQLQNNFNAEEKRLETSTEDNVRGEELLGLYTKTLSGDLESKKILKENSTPEFYNDYIEDILPTGGDTRFNVLHKFSYYKDSKLMIKIITEECGLHLETDLELKDNKLINIDRRQYETATSEY